MDQAVFAAGSDRLAERAARTPLPSGFDHLAPAEGRRLNVWLGAVPPDRPGTA